MAGVAGVALADAVRGVLGLLAVAAALSLFGAALSLFVVALSDFATLGLDVAPGLAVVAFDALPGDEALDLSESAAAMLLLAFASAVDVSGLGAGFAVVLASPLVDGFVSVGVSVRADIDAGGTGAGIVADVSFLSALDLSLVVDDLSLVPLDDDLSPDDLSLTD